MNSKIRLNPILPVLLLIVTLVIISCDTGIRIGDDTPPARIEDLSFDLSSRTLNWTATGDDGTRGRATIYDLRFFTEAEVAELLGLPSLDGVPFSTIEETVIDNFSDATLLPEGLRPDVSGTPQSFLVTRLDPNGTETFFFSLNVRDEVGNSAGPSNVVEVQTPFISADFQDEDPESCFGESIGSGNFNGGGNRVEDDKINDIAIGDPCLGIVYIFYGSPDLSSASADNADVVIIGNSADLFGASVIGVGNIDGDLADELAIGAPGFDGGRGQVLIIRGMRGGLPPIIDLTAGAQPDLSITGQSTGDNFGLTMMSTTNRLFVGAPGAESERGKTYIFRMGDIKRETQASEARAIIIGESAGDMFGFAITNAGFIDDNSFSEFAISSPGAGKVYVFFQDERGMKDLSVDKSDVVVIEGDPSAGFGLSISGGGDIVGLVDDDDNDVDNDERDDLLVGAPNSNMNTGSVFLYSGDDINSAEMNGTSPGFTTEFIGLNPGDRFGTSVAVLGDINPIIGSERRPEAFVLSVTDTNADFAVGAPGVSQVYLFFGQTDFPIVVDAEEADITFPLPQDSPVGEEFGNLIVNLGEVTNEPLEERRLNIEFAGLNTDFGIGGAGFVRVEF